MELARPENKRETTATQRGAVKGWNQKILELQ